MSSPRPPTGALPLDPAGVPRPPVFYVPLNNPVRSTPLRIQYAYTYAIPAFAVHSAMQYNIVCAITFTLHVNVIEDYYE